MKKKENLITLNKDEEEISFGHSREHCKGVCFTGPDNDTFLVAFGIIMVPSFIFYIFISPWLVSNVSVWVLIIALYTLVQTLVLFFFTAYSDPGVIPRAKTIDFDENPFEMEDKNLPETKTVKMKDKEIELRYCDTCNLYRSPRTSHCSLCDNCVLEFDHHCPWVGNCIGKRNYRTFLFFLATVNFYGSYIIFWSIFQIGYLVKNSQYSGGVAFKLALQESFYCSILLISFIGFCLLFTGGLFLYHIRLVILNKTTHEQLKYKNAISPYSTNFINNIYLKLCVSVPPRFTTAHKKVRRKQPA